MHVRTARIRPSLVLYGHPLLWSPVTHEWSAFAFSSSEDSSSLCRPRQCVDDLVAGGTGIASLLVEMPPEAACCAPAGNARATARVAKAAEVTTRTKSMATITFLTVDVEEVVDDIIINYNSCSHSHTSQFRSLLLASAPGFTIFFWNLEAISVELLPNYTTWLVGCYKQGYAITIVFISYEG